MTTSLKALDLPLSIEHALRRGRVYDVETLRNLQPEQLRAIPGMGKKKLGQVNDALLNWEHTGAIKADRKKLNEIPLSDATLIDEITRRGYVVLKGAVIAAQTT